MDKQSVDEDPFENLHLGAPLLSTSGSYCPLQRLAEIRCPSASRAAATADATSFEQLAADSPERKTLATARKRYHSQFGPIETPWLRAVHDETLKLAALNYLAPPGVQPGIVLNGLGTVGKSTIASELGRKYERALRNSLREPINTAAGPLFVPVVYVTLPGNVTVSTFTMLIAQFLGLPTRVTARDGELSGAVIDGTQNVGRHSSSSMTFTSKNEEQKRSVHQQPPEVPRQFDQRHVRVCWDRC